MKTFLTWLWKGAVALGIVGALGFVLQLVDFRDKVAVPVWRYFYPHYEVKIDQHDPINAEEDLTITVTVTKNDARFYGGLKCVWTVDGHPASLGGVDPERLGPACLQWVVSPSDRLHTFDRSKDEHIVTVAEKIFDTGVGKPDAEVTSEPVTFGVRQFPTPKIEVSQTSPYIGEPTRLALTAGALAASDGRCHWTVSAGTVTPVNASGCVASYQPPARLDDPPNNMKVRVSASLDVGKWVGVRATDASLTVLAPEQNVYQYVIEASERMLEAGGKGTLLEAARKQIDGDLDHLSADKGYLGIRIFGNAPPADSPLAQASEPPCKRTTPLVQLGPIVPVDARRSLFQFSTGGKEAPLLLAWRQSLADYHRFTAASKLSNPRYFLVTLVAGGDTCEAKNAIEQLAQLNFSIAAAQLRKDWDRHQLIVFTIATGDTTAWKGTRRAREYESSNGIFILGDSAPVLQASLRAISMLGSQSAADVTQACQALDRILRAQSDQLGASKLSRICRSLREAKR